MKRDTYDAVVVGSGPNGLSAAIVLAQAGKSVVVIEAADRVGGGLRTSELTLPGFLHDDCSAVHPMAVSSPFFRTLPLAEHGLTWIEPPAQLAHPLDDGSAVLLERSADQTARALGVDAGSYRHLIGRLVGSWDSLLKDILKPLSFPRHPLAMARFGPPALRSASALINARFRGTRARALFAGISAHSNLPLERRPSAAFGLVLALAGHAVGWPIPRGGSVSISAALSAELVRLGGEVVLGVRVQDLQKLPRSRVVMMNISPRALVAIAGSRLPRSYRLRLERFRYGPGVFKIDWALAGPIPWRARECMRSATVHLGGTFEEIGRGENLVHRGQVPERPFVILAQPSLFDSTRAPVGRHTAWAYCHVPNGSNVDMTDRIEGQIERFAPGFQDLVLARHVRDSAAIERYNANNVGGDINCGLPDLRQVFLRPVLMTPYRTPAPGLYLCSAATPPGGGVHGMCGFNAARSALKFLQH